MFSLERLQSQTKAEIKKVNEEIEKINNLKKVNEEKNNLKKVNEEIEKINRDLKAIDIDIKNDKAKLERISKDEISYLAVPQTVFTKMLNIKTRLKKLEEQKQEKLKKLEEQEKLKTKSILSTGISKHLSWVEFLENNLSVETNPAISCLDITTINNELINQKEKLQLLEEEKKVPTPPKITIY